MPLEGVDLDALATQSAGLSGADIEALCDAAGMQALLRGQPKPAVTAADFAAALAERDAGKGTSGIVLPQEQSWWRKPPPIGKK